MISSRQKNPEPEKAKLSRNPRLWVAVRFINLKTPRRSTMSNKVKIVLSGGHGGFSLSELAKKALGKDNKDYRTLSSRLDTQLIEVVEKLGRDASVDHGGGHYIYVVEITPGWHYVLDDYDGQESLIRSASPIYSGSGSWQLSEYIG